MRIFERSVTRQYWQAMYKYLRRKVHRGQIVSVTDEVVRVWCGVKNISYAILDEDRPIAWVYLERQPGWVAWEVAQVFVFPAYRGNGYARKIYEAAVLIDGILLASGKTQGKDSRALWKKMIAENRLNIWACDFKNLKSTSEVFIDEDGNLECGLQIYQPVKARTKEDVRLLAYRK